MSAETSLSLGLGDSRIYNTRHGRYSTAGRSTAQFPSTAVSTRLSARNSSTVKCVASEDANKSGLETSHSCPACGKQFVRYCDLNKHAKSHSRPFKCSVPGCKYVELGWPTAKELERHQNDKHSVAPRQFACHFARCDYKSKRESNCKQHMEKTHGWKYVRSKSGGRAKKVNDDDGGVGGRDLAPQLKSTGDGMWLEDSAMADPANLLSRPAQIMPNDFVLYDNIDQPLAPDATQDRFLGLEYPEDEDSQVYLPWTSPDTRLRKTESFLERFSRTYSHSSEPRAGHDVLMIDPRLSHPNPGVFVAQLTPQSPVPPVDADFMGSHGSLRKPVAPSEQGDVPPSHDPPMVRPKRKQSNSTADGYGSLAAQIFDVENDPAGQTSTNQGSLGNTSSANLIHGSSTSHKLTSVFDSTPVKRGAEDSDEDDELQLPRKRVKLSDPDDFAEDEMPCIFKFAHPDMYGHGRDVEDGKISSCDTKHKDISQLVRHLSRTAHRLLVNTRVVSSFESHGNTYPHPIAGLCRRCWRSFEDKQQFEQHIRGDCPKVSKGKREKFFRLHDTFCGLVGSRAAEDSDNSTTSSDQNTGNSSAVPRSNEGGHPPANTAITGGPLSAPDETPDDRPVRMRDYRVLSERLSALERAHQRLAQATRAMWQGLQRQRNNTRASLGHLAGVPINQPVPNQSPGTPPPSRDLLPPDAASPVHARAMGRRSLGRGADGPDQAVLVGHMTSQSTDVDRAALMAEVQQSLSRANSGSSTRSARSSVHHVPMSPPPPPRDGRGVTVARTRATVAAAAAAAAAAARGAVGAGVGRHPPTSLTDSGYATNMQRTNSFSEDLVTKKGAAITAEAGQAEHVEHALASVPPPSSDPAGARALAEEPSQRLLGTEEQRQDPVLAESQGSGVGVAGWLPQYLPDELHHEDFHSPNMDDLSEWYLNEMPSPPPVAPHHQPQS